MADHNYEQLRELFEWRFRHFKGIDERAIGMMVDEVKAWLEGGE